jgi:hypothetical protein
MSTLEGGRDHSQVYPVANPFGPRLRERARLPLEGATDVAVDATGRTAYVVGRGALTVVDVARPGRPAVVAQLQGIGQGRQIEVLEGIAAVTARPDGLFICDVNDREHPRLLCHYDTVELATGVCLSAQLGMIACRHMGVEIVDLSDPAHPAHVSNVLAGEAQSIFVDGNIMYVGAWMQREVQIFDIANAAAPQRLGTCLLDGFADGLYVKDGRCYAATGHHARGLLNRRKYLNYDFVTEAMLRDGYGGGHGLEIYDVSDPARPRLLSRLKTPPLFMSGNDMWDVVVSGPHAFLSDTYNGVFVVNVAQPQGCYFAGYRRLDPLEETAYRHEPSIQQLCEPVTGIALINDHLLAVSPSSGLHVLEAPSGTTTPAPPRAASARAGAAPASSPTAASPEVVFTAAGQVHSLAPVDDRLVVAAGSAGLYVLAGEGAPNVVAHTPTGGPALDLKTDGRLIYVAEGRAGVSIWELTSAGLSEVSRCHDFSEGACRQVVLLGRTGLAAVQLGVGHVALLDVSTASEPRCRDVQPVGGNLYYKSIVEGLFADRYFAVVPLAPGIVWYDIADPTRLSRAAVSIEQQLCPIEEGAALGQDGVFTIFRGRYAYSRGVGDIPGERGALTLWDEQDGAPRREVYLSGRPTLIDEMLCLLNRQTGQLTLLDVADPDHPRVARQRPLAGHPEQILRHKDAYWVSCGHAGLQRVAL